MIIILYLSVALIAVAFLILVISLTKTLKSMKITMDRVSKTMEDLEGQLQGITSETTLLLHKTNELAEDIQNKSEKLNTVVYAVQDIGTTIKEFNGSIRKVSSNLSTQVVHNQDKIAQVLQWGSVLKELKDKWMEKKERKKEPVTFDEQADVELREVKRVRSE
ncbi:DUF948 domain-containing protein [Heyndrickxia camelliae]|uniref:DUF948 domain-containing protein n=1 Tax=Heyndrickxia camelliae TaxID=1707093 RepID=A0A2N3LIH6_9BACI|nr:DUF948 domain-containing protein [Heyndrickxia camelliae]PKR84333.1 DUF948 domain-containing protein [Heyndrickxia camelliae]